LERSRVSRLPRTGDNRIGRPMRTMFTVYFVLILAGIGFYAVIGATHN
jgi:hypothetical protein